MAGDIARIETAEAPAPAGHYSQGTAWGGLVFVSGQLGTMPDGTKLNTRPFAEQARQALANMLAIAAAGGAGPEDFLKVTAYVAGAEHWPEFNAIFAATFGQSRPARAIVPVPELHYCYLVEVEGIAVQRTAAS